MASFITAGNATNGLQVSSDNTGILELRTGTGSGTTALTLNTSQNAGLGVTPSAWKSNYRAVQVGNALSAVGRTDVNTIYLASNWYVNSSDQDVRQNAGFASLYAQADGQHRWYYAASSTAGSTITFTQAMTLDASGNLGVGSGSPVAVLDVVQPSASANAGRVAYFRSTASGDVANNAVIISKFDNNTTTSQIFMKFEVNNTATSCGRINANGANTAAFGSTSDRRIKENIEDLPSQLQNILALRPVEFDYIESYGGGHQIGFIAQEMQEVYPDVVSADESEEQILSITGWSKTEARLVKAIQELNAKVDAQAAEIAALKAQP